MAKILIIDDDPDIVDSLTMILEANGHNVQVKPDNVFLCGERRTDDGFCVLALIVGRDDHHRTFPLWQWRSTCTPCRWRFTALNSTLDFAICFHRILQSF